MEYLTTISGMSLEARLRGRLTFADYESFRTLLGQLCSQDAGTVVLDLNGVEFVDSAALGMLLLARDELAAACKQIVLRHPRRQVARMLAIARFDELLPVEA